MLVIIRQLPLSYHDPSYDAYVSITRHCFYQEGGDYNYQTTIDLPGLFTDVVFAGYLEVNPHTDFKDIDSDKKYIKFANSRLKTYKGSLSKFCRVERNPDKKQGECDRLVFHQMPPSFTCVIKTKRQREQKEAVRYLDMLNERTASEMAQ